MRVREGHQMYLRTPSITLRIASDKNHRYKNGPQRSAAWSPSDSALRCLQETFGGSSPQAVQIKKSPQGGSF